MSKYRVDFHGFAYVEAEDEDDAREKVEDGFYAYMEYASEAEEVDEFLVTV